MACWGCGSGVYRKIGFDDSLSRPEVSYIQRFISIPMNHDYGWPLHIPNGTSLPLADHPLHNNQAGQCEPSHGTNFLRIPACGHELSCDLGRNPRQESDSFFIEV